MGPHRKTLTRVETEPMTGFEIAIGLYTVAKSINLGFATKKFKLVAKCDNLPCTIFRLNLPYSLDSDTRPERPGAAHVF